MFTPLSCCCGCVCCCSRFPQLPGGVKEGVGLQAGIAVEMLLGLVLNVVVLYAMGRLSTAADIPHLNASHR